MRDKLSKEQRSHNMARIGPKGTWSEKYVGAILDELGISYKENIAVISGKPDLFVPDFSSLILVHGCFWHGHGCLKSKWPDNNADFWRRKIVGTMKRDRRNLSVYRHEGYWVLTIWECALRGKSRLDKERLTTLFGSWLSSGKRNMTISGRGQPRRAIGTAV